MSYGGGDIHFFFQKLIIQNFVNKVHLYEKYCIWGDQTPHKDATKAYEVNEA